MMMNDWFASNLSYKNSIRYISTKRIYSDLPENSKNYLYVVIIMFALEMN